MLQVGENETQQLVQVESLQATNDPALQNAHSSFAEVVSVVASCRCGSTVAQDHISFLSAR